MLPAKKFAELQGGSAKKEGGKKEKAAKPEQAKPKAQPTKKVTLDEHLMK